MLAQRGFYGNNPAAVGLRTQREVRPKSEWDLLLVGSLDRLCEPLEGPPHPPLGVVQSARGSVFQHAGCQGKCRVSAECRRCPSSVPDTQNHQCRPRLARPGHAGGCSH